MMDDRRCRNSREKKTAVGKYILIFVNMFLIFVSVMFSWSYSQNLKKQQEKNELDAFCDTVDTMKQISDNYLRMELGYARDWAQYINEEHMTLEEALSYINKSNYQKERYAHIVDMDTYEGYSSYKSEKSVRVSCYQQFRDSDDETYQSFQQTMEKMFANEGDFNILGKYRADDTQTNVISVGTRVSLYTAQGSTKDYLLLCVVPVESIRKLWIFPIEYKAAEVGIITKTGAYVVPSASMKSLSFSEFMLGYNFVDDYRKVDELLRQLEDKESGVLQYKDARGQLCYWYYSSLGKGSALDILGYIPVESLQVASTNWLIVFMTCGILAVLAAADGLYFVHINRKLRKTAKVAEEASQAKTQFLSTMSHDIRTPMNGIIGMTKMAKAHIDDPVYASQCLDKVSLTSDHLLTLINDILDISKIESGTMVLNPAIFSLENSTEKLVDIVQVQSEEKHLHFEKRLELTEPYLVADELRLNQIFINLLTNAIKYTQDGGWVRMSVREEATEEENSVRLIYRVEDNGIGMTEEFQQNMYRRFSRERDGRIEKIQGTGLGLAIVKQMVDLMGGTITCESVVNQGTVFTVMIDVVRGTEEEYRMRYGAVDDGQDHFEHIRVLVAEDNDINWEIISALLEDTGVHCDRAEDGQDCIEKLQAAEKEPYDLVFMDIQMPVMNGKEAARQIRKSNMAYIKNVTVIAMTADAFAEDIQACMDAGMDGHIAKPVDTRRVIEVLRQVRQKKGEKKDEEQI